MRGERKPFARCARACPFGLAASARRGFSSSLLLSLFRSPPAGMRRRRRVLSLLALRCGLTASTPTLNAFTRDCAGPFFVAGDRARDR